MEERRHALCVREDEKELCRALGVTDARVVHYRYAPILRATKQIRTANEFAAKQGLSRLRVEEKGGKTVVRVTAEDGEAEGVAYCSRSDNYDRTRGRKMALGRALEILSQRRIYRDASAGDQGVGSEDWLRAKAAWDKLRLLGTGTW